MGPLRILILAVLFYLGYRLIKANFSKSDEKKKDEKQDEKAQQGGAITDVLIEDPVCHKLVPKQQAYALEAEDGVHYFCSKQCGDKFAADPENSDQDSSSDQQEAK
ncbi:MAG: YHS domain-containing protein [Desulfofustis sp.]|nr:YHS domain-containing protein [Desulfofustis sp.]NNF47778.1 YHS domain-containing protein [Desulfofustis sp.]